MYLHSIKEFFFSSPVCYFTWICTKTISKHLFLEFCFVLFFHNSWKCMNESTMGCLFLLVNEAFYTQFDSMHTCQFIHIFMRNNKGSPKGKVLWKYVPELLFPEKPLLKQMTYVRRLVPNEQPFPKWLIRAYGSTWGPLLGTSIVSLKNASVLNSWVS